MKNFYLSLLFVAISFFANAQDCYWAKKAGGTQDDQAYSITTDKSGNICVTGGLQSPNAVFGTYTLTGTGGVFVAKYSPSGNVLWAKRLNTGGQGNSIATDANGNIYVAGNFGGTFTLGTYTLTDHGQGDIFVAKFDSMGNVLWGKSIGGSVFDEGKGVTTDYLGNTYFTGHFYSDTVIFANDTLINKKNPSTGTNIPDIIIGKFDSSGNPLWAKRAGGRNYDEGHDVVCDKANNLYVTGLFENDTISFGSTALTNSIGGAVFVTKYNSTGAVLWAKDFNVGIGNQSGAIVKIAIDSLNNFCIAGDFSTYFVAFGNDTAFAPMSGASNPYVAKFDSNGNILWAKAGYGNDYNYTRDVALDNAGNAYITGYFKSPKLIFETDTLYNSTSNNWNMFIAKYSSAGVLQWAKHLGGSWSFGQSITPGKGGNVYFAGGFGSSLGFGGTSLSSAGYRNVYVADLYSFSSGITSSTNVSCYGADDGNIIGFANGGHQPYTYSWGFIPANLNDTVFVTSNDTLKHGAAGYYNLYITEGYGCTQNSNITLTEPPMDSTHICMVTVDSASQHNIIIWDKTGYTDLDSFIVCREIATNNYQPIAAIPYSALSMFTDTVRTKYFPNTGDPNAGTYRYKIKGHSSCGGYTYLSPFHNTIYILNNAGTFYWTQPYTIEGGSNPVASYVLMRDNLSNGNWVQVSSVAGTQQTVSDPLYTIYQNTASWRVQTNWSIACTPTLRVASGVQNNFSTSLSNVYTNVVNAVKDNSLNTKLNVYPNPSSGKFVLEYSSLEKNKSVSVEVYNMIGKKVYSQSDLPNNQTTIDLSSFSSGVYFLNLKTGNSTLSKRVIIQN